MPKSGFTIIELLIAMAIFSVLSIGIYAAVSSTVEATGTSTAKGELMQSLRDVMREMTRELQVAAAENDPTLADPLFGLRVEEIGGDPIGVTFQVPLGKSGESWSGPIRYVWVNEDDDGDARLDPGEDENGDGALTRRIMRIEDMNKDGDTTDPNEVRPLAAANDISNVRFAFDGDVLTVTLTATRRPNHNRDYSITASLSGKVFLMN